MQATQLEPSNPYPALHPVHIPVSELQLVHPMHDKQKPDPPNEKDKLGQA